MKRGLSSGNCELDKRDNGIQYYTVYGIRYRAANKVVYVGSTARHWMNDRGSEHFNLASGARRVVTAFAQPHFQPVDDCFAIEELWSGQCSVHDIHALEQHMMDKHDTRVSPRPTDGVTKDIDLLQGTAPLQLNVNKSCLDEQMVNAAALRVAKDTALSETRRTPTEVVMMENTLREVMAITAEISETTAVAKIYKHMLALKELLVKDACHKLGVKDVHQCLNDILTAFNADDGQELKDLLISKLFWYNADKRGHGYTVRAAVVYGEIAMLLYAMGLTPENSSRSTHNNEEQTSTSKTTPGVYRHSKSTPTLSRRLYDNFTESTPVLKDCRAGHLGVKRMYVEITCPYCNDTFTDIPAESIRTSKASRCKKHIDAVHSDGTYVKP